MHKSKGMQNTLAILFVLIALLVVSFAITFVALRDYTSVPSKTVSSDSQDSGLIIGSMSRDANADPYLDENLYVLNYVANKNSKHSDGKESSVDLNKGLLLYLPFDESSGVESFTDSSGNGFDAFCTSSECPDSGVLGRKGKALSFDGVNDLVLVPYSSAFSLSSFSVSFWFKGSSTEAGQFFVGTWDGGSGNVGWQASLAEGGICDGISFYVSEDGSSGDDSHRAYRRKCGQTYQDGNWHHFVGTFRPGSDISMYVDGNFVGTLVGNITDINGVHNSGLPIRIGSGFGNNAADVHFDGSIDELRLYNRVISLDEIKSLGK